MREILFRGKRKDNGSWICGGINVFEEKTFIIIKTRYIPDTRDSTTVESYEKYPYYEQQFIEVIPETVGQFTGVVDKNGIDIYEGDIIHTEHTWWPDVYVLWDGECMNWSVVTLDCSPGKGDYDINRADLGYIAAEPILIDKWTWEVIGNIYDNDILVVEDYNDNKEPLEF